MSSPYNITIQGVKQTKDNKFKQTTLKFIEMTKQILILMI